MLNATHIITLPGFHRGRTADQTLFVYTHVYTDTYPTERDEAALKADSSRLSSTS